MSALRIIGLAGRMGSGKDTAAIVLKAHGYERKAFADALRCEVYERLDAHSDAPIAMPPMVREAYYKCLQRDIFDKPTKDHARIVLQWWGGWRREQWESYWIAQVLYRMDPERMYAVSDVRYANEARAIQLVGGQVWRIDGRGGTGGIANHESERLDFPVDRVIPNTGSLADFEAAVTQALLDSRAKASIAPESSAA